MPKNDRNKILTRLKKITIIVITADVIEFIISLSPKAADKIIRSLENLSEFGFSLPKTAYHRLWDSKYKLWELITSFGKNEYRSLFFTVDKGKILIAHAILKNTDRVPLRDIHISDKVYEEWIEMGGKL